MGKEISFFLAVIQLINRKRNCAFKKMSALQENDMNQANPKKWSK
jgi:hypothetical protein